MLFVILITRFTFGSLFGYLRWLRYVDSHFVWICCCSRLRFTFDYVYVTVTRLHLVTVIYTFALLHVTVYVYVYGLFVFWLRSHVCYVHTLRWLIAGYVCVHTVTRYTVPTLRFTLGCSPTLRLVICLRFTRLVVGCYSCWLVCLRLFTLLRFDFVWFVTLVTFDLVGFGCYVGYVVVVCLICWLFVHLPDLWVPVGYVPFTLLHVYTFYTLDSVVAFTYVRCCWLLFTFG